MEILILILKTAYSTLPAILANMAPLFVKKIPFLNVPMDFGLTIKGKPILGPKKTFRGLVAGVIMGVLVMHILYMVYKYTPYKNLTIFSFEKINFYLLGFLMGFGVIMGDAIASFIKRRLGKAPSESIIVLDQLDCVLGGLAFGRIAWDFPWRYGVIIIVLTFFMHIFGRHIAYYMGLCETKW